MLMWFLVSHITRPITYVMLCWQGVGCRDNQPLKVEANIFFLRVINVVQQCQHIRLSYMLLIMDIWAIKDWMLIGGATGGGGGGRLERAGSNRWRFGGVWSFLWSPEALEHLEAFLEEWTNVGTLVECCHIGERIWCKFILFWIH